MDRRHKPKKSQASRASETERGAFLTHPELLNVAVPLRGVLLQLLMQLSPLAFQELFSRPFGRCVFFRGLFQTQEVNSLDAIEWW